MTHSPHDTALFYRADLPRGQHLVTPRWLASVLQGEAVPGAPAPRWCLLEVACGAPGAYAQAHIPGAGYLDTESLETIPFWNKVDDALLLRALLALGITHDTTVVLYGRSATAPARAAHLMLYAGVRDVRLLDGGWSAWQQAGLAQAAGPPPAPVAARDFGGPFPACPHYLIDLPQAQRWLSRADTALVSVRTWAEFSGQTSGYSYIPRRGDIPGARWGRAGEDGDINSMSDYLQPNGTLKPAAEVVAYWRAQGIASHQHLAFYCGTGWRASLAFFYAWAMGWERVAVFDGGWFEWSSATLTAAAAAAPAHPAGQIRLNEPSAARLAPASCAAPASAA